MIGKPGKTFILKHFITMSRVGLSDNTRKTYDLKNDFLRGAPRHGQDFRIRTFSTNNATLRYTVEIIRIYEKIQCTHSEAKNSHHLGQYICYLAFVNMLLSVNIPGVNRLMSGKAVIRMLTTGDKMEMY